MFRPRSIALIQLCVLLIGFLLVAGCATQQSVKTIPPPPTPSAEAEADARLRSGDFRDAAEAYARLAQSADAKDKLTYLSLATLAYLELGDAQSAAGVLVLASTGPFPNHPSHALASAAIDNFKSGTEQAKRHLATVDARKLSPYQRSVYNRTTADIAMFEHNYAAAASAFTAADSYVLPQSNRATLHQNLWRALSHMDDEAIAFARRGSVGNDAGWLDLIANSRANLHNGTALASGIESWRGRNPEHPANITLVEYLLEVSESLSVTARHIALLLPFHGRFANEANAIRDGFLSAWYGSTAGTKRPVVSLYTVDTANVNEAYDLAVANGADLIVGPLEKAAVQALTSRDELAVRTLTLNVANNLTPGSEAAASAHLFQFGLIPGDEAAAAAIRLRSDGHLRVVVIGPETPWGERLTKRFNQEWINSGGIVLDQVRYGDADNSYSLSVKEALNIDLSEARVAALRRALNRTIQFEPRRRADLDAIFLAGFPVSARQILPQLRYFRAEDVPVYSTSHAFTGSLNAAADQDLDGLYFGDMPWLLGAADSASFNLFRNNWPDRAAGAGRLFAFGLDAYRILPYLARMRNQPSLRVPGTTGVLSMRHNGRIVRGISWARFTRGQPNLLGP